MAPGSCRGFSMVNCLLRLLAPRNKFTREVGTWNTVARYLRKCRLALPSAGGAVMRTFRLSP
mgnify:CR=1 FL=1